MIIFDKEEGFIKSKGIKRKEGYEDIVLPKIAIGVFSNHLINDIVQKFNCCEVGYIHCASYDRPVYILKYKDKEFTFFMAGIGGPHITSNVHELKASGIEKIILFGSCGVLDSRIEDCSIIIPTRAYRDEGASYHYMEDSEYVEINNKYKDLFKQVLKEQDFDYTEGFTWTTDCFYRETRNKINYFKEKGCVCVEMEGASVKAACNYEKIDLFTFYYAGDNLDSIEWDRRSLSGDTELDKKNKVALLAFELAYRIN